MLADAYAQFRRRPPVRPTARRCRYPSRARAVSRGGEAWRRPCLAGEFTYRGAVDRDGKLAFLRASTCCRCPPPMTSPRACSPRGNGERRRPWFNRVWRVHRNRREDRRRSAGDARTTHRRRPTACSWQDPCAGHDARCAWRRRRRRATASPVPRIGCSSYTTRCCGLRSEMADSRASRSVIPVCSPSLQSAI